MTLALLFLLPLLILMVVVPVTGPQSSQPGPRDYQRDPCAFIDRYITRNELGQPFVLLPHQRVVLSLAFAFDEDGKLPWDTIVYSARKKSGKTTINAAYMLWWAFTQEPPNELKSIANDLEQRVARTFATVKGLLRYNPELGRSADIKATTITFSTDSVIEATANDYAGEAGSNPGWTSWTELWASVSERSRRMWEEFVSSPVRRNSPRFIDTYAGFEGESELLFGLYTLGVGPEEHVDGQGERLHPTLPIYGNREARLFVYWDHDARMPWQTTAYYYSQARTLRPSMYLRLHENRWVSAESTFITPDLWDPCLVTGLTPVLADPRLAVVVGVDGALKHDTAAIVAVCWDGSRLRLVNHKIWTPSPTAPLDLETTIEAELRQWSVRFDVRRIVCDPWQLARSIATLRAAGLPIEEFGQTSANLTRAESALFDALTGRNLMLYSDAALRAQALNTVAIESMRGGFRIAKERANKKIDAIVALAIACAAAIGHGPRAGDLVACIKVSSVRQDYALQRAHELLVSDRAARRADDHRRDDEFRQLVLSTAQPARDPFSALRRVAAEHGLEAARDLFVEVNGAGARLPAFLEREAPRRVVGSASSDVRRG